MDDSTCRCFGLLKAVWLQVAVAARLPAPARQFVGFGWKVSPTQIRGWVGREWHFRPRSRRFVLGWQRRGAAPGMPSEIWECMGHIIRKVVGMQGGAADLPQLCESHCVPGSLPLGKREGSVFAVSRCDC